MGGGAPTSTGRGGAGNMASGTQIPPPPEEKNLYTPTLKSDHYTTGRGGSGNMAKNDRDDPTEARRAQDVGVPSVVGKKDEGNFHTGRGGAANVVRSNSTEAPPKVEEVKKEGKKESILDKGKHLLGLDKK